MHYGMDERSDPVWWKATVKGSLAAVVFALLSGCVATPTRYHERERIGDFVSHVASTTDSSTPCADTTPVQIERTATFNVPLSGLDARCHRIEWRVTRRFSLDDLKTSAAPGDLALFAWYVDITNDGNAHAIDSCPVGE